jgi:hypothetical protein
LENVVKLWTAVLLERRVLVMSNSKALIGLVF